MPRTAGITLTPGDLEPVQVLGALVAAIGERELRVNPYGDDSHIANNEPAYNLDWNDVDQKYKNIPLHQLGQQMSAAVHNESYGLPLLFGATEVAFSNRDRWEFVQTEIDSVEWVKVGPTGIPRTSKWSQTKESGSTNRYKHFVSIPNEAIVDPLFGLDTIRHALSMIIQTLIYTLMVLTSTNLAARPMYNDYKARVPSPYF